MKDAMASAVKPAGHCIVCNAPRSDGGSENFVCFECGDPKGMVFVCAKCGNRKNFRTDEKDRLIEELGEAVSFEQNDGAVITASCCAKCTRLLGGHTEAQAYYIARGGKN